ncbi:hemolysin-type calcium-binding region [Pseudomonas sp. StFLB209]|uniref:beta strand repeat-containing protein n=1 Tax=Pseudomonas sp. StFLB209 TaxID=1028989 RepID=UPI0004F8B089|nr:calcium-binding protein [Pseudomonas sp. StFLB209]BAP44126.1 hemolysin-type calcium-binding region [Pseudomonas sp. StFLB209]
MAVINGTSGADTLTGTSDSDQINGLAGNDVIHSSAGADKIVGGVGTDTVDYSKSAEGISIDVRAGVGLAGRGGDAEGDILETVEKVVGSVFNDTLAIGAIATMVTLEGGAGDDTYIIGHDGTPIIVEQANGGNDEVRVTVLSKQNTRLADNIERLTYVGNGAFTGYGNALDNIITGGSGGDKLYGGAGADQFIGGAGNDTVGYDDSTTGVSINLKTGEKSGIAAGDTYTDIEVIWGSNANDTFVGDGSGMDFNGLGGIDTVDYSGSASAVDVSVSVGNVRAGIGGDAEGTVLNNIERIVGSAFNDTLAIGTISTMVTLEGGAGDDTYIIGHNGTPIVVEQANGGNDEVRVTVLNQQGTRLADNIERLTYVGNGAFTGYGNALDNIITGGSGNNTLYGGAGDDQIIGGAGSDTLNGGEGADQLIGGAGYDTAGYADSISAGVTVNLKTGIHSGFAAGDTYVDIEAISGSNFNDVFYADSSSTGWNGVVGQDMVTYELSETAVTVDLFTGTNAGDADGDTYASIEIIQGSTFGDTLSGSRLADTFIGGAGADTIDGREGHDSVWYITSAAGVTINLQTQSNQGGDAEGDVLSNIERLVGSHFNDALTGDAGVNYLEGGLGDDIIEGGEGGDYIFGGLASQIGSFTLVGQTNGPQADTLYGGNGNDTIVTAANDLGSRVYGEAGGDVITVVHGMADGGDGNDVLTGTGLDFSLFGGSGSDQLVLHSSGWANGGEGSDTYTVRTTKLVMIQDDGASYGDKLVLSQITSSELLFDQIGNDLYLHRYSLAAGQTPQEGVLLKDWFAGYDTIEHVQTADMQLISLSGLSPTTSSLA